MSCSLCGNKPALEEFQTSHLSSSSLLCTLSTFCDLIKDTFAHSVEETVFREILQVKELDDCERKFLLLS